MNIAPTLEDQGMRILLPQGRHRELELLASTDLGGACSSYVTR